MFNLGKIYHLMLGKNIQYKSSGHVGHRKKMLGGWGRQCGSTEDLQVKTKPSGSPQEAAGLWPLSSPRTRLPGLTDRGHLPKGTPNQHGNCPSAGPRCRFCSFLRNIKR